MSACIEYDAAGRMRYHPDFHAAHKKPWTNKDEQFLIENYLSLGPEAVALALERTIATVMGRACSLRKAGKMPPRKPKDLRHKRARNAS